MAAEARVMESDAACHRGSLEQTKNLLEASRTGWAPESESNPKPLETRFLMMEFRASQRGNCLRRLLT